jgi:hypothetical protein
MASTKKPSEVIKAWVTAQSVLAKDVNDNSISLAGIISYLQAAETDHSTIKSDYSDGATKFNTIVQSLRAVKK